MASESGETVSVVLPDDLGTWLDERAAEAEVDRDELVRQLVAAYRVSAEGDAPVEGDVAGELEARVSGLEREFDEKIDDVRKRILQLKRDVEGKAPAGHDHEGLDRVEAVDRRLDSVIDDLESLRDGLEAVDGRTEDHAAAIEDVRDRLVRVASAVVRMSDGESGQLSTLRRAAASAGVDEAACEACGGTVHVSLLSEAVCPHCGTGIADVEPGSGFFSGPTLVAGGASTAEDGG
jgi:hypothetical protein